MRLAALAAAALVLLAACDGGDEERLVDGSDPPRLPAALAGLDAAVMTRVTTVRPGQVDPTRLAACGVHRAVAGDDASSAVERAGLRGASLTLAIGSSLTACDAIPDPAVDPDHPYEGIWCGVSAGRVQGGHLTDPRLDVCNAKGGELTAFAWIDPRPEAKWIVVSGGSRREIYEVAAGLPVRVTTTDGVRVEGTASLNVEEYAADGKRLLAYTRELGVAG